MQSLAAGALSAIAASSSSEGEGAHSEAITVSAVEKVKATLVDALKQAASQPGEQRLYKSGKLDGVFPGRTGVNAEAAAQELRRRSFRWHA